MLNTAFVLFLIVVILYFLIKYIKRYLNSITLKSSIDGRYYTVRKTKNCQQAVDTLATLNKRAQKLIEYIQDSDPNFSDNIRQLTKKYSIDSLIENIDLENTSYTVNKGQEVVMCLSPRKDNVIYDHNLLMFVMIHELSHIGCKTQGHTDEFKQFFKFLITKAIDCNCGIYIYQNYNENPEEYCGLIINSNPV